MLTKLRLKNWRSLRDVSINFTPITVLIGANSSGKTNILDALHFARYATTQGVLQAMYYWQGLEKFRNINATPKQAVSIELGFRLVSQKQVTAKLNLKQSTRNELAHSHSNTGKSYWKVTSDGVSPTNLLQKGFDELLQKDVEQIISQRWQLFREGFLPAPRLASDADPGDLYIVDPLARNVAFMLDYMKQIDPDLYEKLQADVATLLAHVTEVTTRRDERETSIIISEKILKNRDASTISTGTLRIIAMLTAYYALDMRNADQPGLVVIEEPDTAIHPLLLGNFVDLLRGYTEREQPRQFILTTHNPQMLNYFEPEEVRVVERDSETGETWVDPVPDYIREVWLPKHRLGEAWTSRVIGGIPEQ